MKFCNHVHLEVEDVSNYQEADWMQLLHRSLVTEIFQKRDSLPPQCGRFTLRVIGKRLKKSLKANQ